MAPRGKPRKPPILSQSSEPDSQIGESVWEKSLTSAKSAIFNPTDVMPAMVMLVIGELLLNVFIVKLRGCE